MPELNPVVRHPSLIGFSESDLGSFPRPPVRDGGLSLSNPQPVEVGSLFNPI
jgi:hypothetical protein